MTIRNLILPSTLLLSFIFINPTSSEAQFFKRKKKTEQSEDDTKKKSDFKKISAVTKGAEVFEGLFDM
jgi:hypothetical protein